ncbi:hypothetical protein WHI96_26135 [Pseudonocardia tropica]|uniref:Uncharacterized protein n=1 Tax=Pseudonocardia tropica TaxID=681289 RepID=A0ABV1K5C0_9PSEU
MSLRPPAWGLLLHAKAIRSVVPVARGSVRRWRGSWKVQRRAAVASRWWVKGSLELIVAGAVASIPFPPADA